MGATEAAAAQVGTALLPSPVGRTGGRERGESPRGVRARAAPVASRRLHGAALRGRAAAIRQRQTTATRRRRQPCPAPGEPQAAADPLPSFYPALTPVPLAALPLSCGPMRSESGAGAGGWAAPWGARRPRGRGRFADGKRVLRASPTPVTSARARSSRWRAGNG